MRKIKVSQPVVDNRALEAAPPSPVVVPATVEKITASEAPGCPQCGSKKTTVYSKHGSYRYRSCLGCGRSFTTLESVVRSA